ncbi:hypothetical protein [Halomonas sp. NCCP-2165]|nr:hypothetical protein [Halomonas sp. NCCP-2165]GKW48614.1 hypothetical protein NCCP2165_08290 [Halomonas sp. NCCP-2165]
MLSPSGESGWPQPDAGVIKTKWLEMGGGRDVATLDPWYLIFDKAGDLVDALLHEQPKGEFDAIDFEGTISDTVEKIASAEFNPQEDWSVIIRPVNNGEKLDEKIDRHFEIAVRQSVYVRILYEYNMGRIKENYSESSQPGMLMKVGETMLSAFACAQQHATAWRILKEVRNKSYDKRSQAANQIKAEKKSERELLLRSLIEPALERLRPSGNWRSHVFAAQVIAKYISEISSSCSLPISDNEDELSEKIERMIFTESRLRKAYNENAKQPLDEPAKTRKMNMQVNFGEKK